MSKVGLVRACVRACTRMRVSEKGESFAMTGKFVHQQLLVNLIPNTARLVTRMDINRR